MKTKFAYFAALETPEIRFMQRAIELAGFGQGFVSPNPMVGCVITSGSKIIGEGFHAKYGMPHAEVNAINAVTQKDLLPDSTLYVSLEPCSHTGKTPPCTNLILQSGIRKVVVAAEDPNPKVAGSGIRLLREAGLEVQTGILQNEAQFINRRFFTFHQEKRPYIILRWAESADGFCDHDRSSTKRESIPVSGIFSRQLSHIWRTQEQAILVGAQTVLTDDPSLTPRLWPGKPPLRILFDPSLRAPENSQLLQDGYETLVFNHLKSEQSVACTWIKIDTEQDFIEALKEELYSRKILSFMVEGGPETLRRFLAIGAWDEIRRFRSPNLITKGVSAPQLNVPPDISQASGDDTLEVFFKPFSKLIG